MNDIPEIAGNIVQPLANNLGMVGLIIVLLFMPIVIGILYLLKYSWDKHALERTEWKNDADRREDRAEKRDEKNAQAMQNLTDAIRYMHNSK